MPPRRRAGGDRPRQQRQAAAGAGQGARRHRAARFVCHLSLSDGRRILLEAGGVLEGVIARQPSGSNGFGYDPIFFVQALGLTTAQLPAEGKNEISHRGLASREFARRLGKMLQLRTE